MNFNYDEHEDILYATISEGPAITVEADDGRTLLRTDPDTGALVGATIFDFKASLTKALAAALAAEGEPT